MKSTKKALLLSITSMLLCVAMLMGTTFAWFTDSVTSGNNKIIAGNLDIDVEFTKDGSTWTALENAETVFSDGLWEPGYTEYVTLKITNKGTLALNYKALVTPVSENGGVNVNGETFKLSDYLVFKTVKNGETAPAAYTRDTARAAAGDVKGLADVNALTQTGSLAAGKTEYVTLVVYMPEEVGNAANYLTGTAAPSIELAISVLAAQKSAESDSFGNDYDEEAVNVPKYVAGAYYDYFEAVYVSGTSDGDKNFAVKKEVSSEIIASAVGKTENAGEKVNLTVVKSIEAVASFSVAADEEAKGYEIKVTGQKEGSLVKTSLFVGTGLENFKFYHNGALMTAVASKATVANDGEYFYDAATGYVDFATTSFSPFQATYKAPAAAIGTAVYGTLAEAIAAVKAGETIVVLKDATGVAGIAVASGKDFTVDFAGHTYAFAKRGAGSAGTETQAFQLLKDSTITFKNGTLACTEANKDAVNDANGKPILRIIQNYANLTLENMVIDGSNMAHNAGRAGYVLSFNNGASLIKDTKILVANGDIAFDSYHRDGDTYYPSCSVTITGNSVIYGQVIVDGGTIVANEGSFSDDPTAFVVAGRGALKIDGLYRIVDTWLTGVEPYATAEDLTITTAAELAKFAATVNAGKNYEGKTVTLGADIDLAGKIWNSIGSKNGQGGYYQYPFCGTFNGAGYAIKNMNITKATAGETYTGLFALLSGSAKVENLTVENSSLVGQRVGTIVGCASGAGVVINNVTVKNVSITGEQKCGGIVGFDRYDGPTETLAVTNCKVDGVSFQSNPEDHGSSFGGLIGFISAMSGLTVTGNDVKNITFENTLTDAEIDALQLEYTAYEMKQYNCHPFIATLIANTETMPIVFSGNTVDNSTCPNATVVYGTVVDAEINTFFGYVRSILVDDVAALFAE